MHSSPELKMRMEGHTDVQHEIIMPRYYGVTGYKNEIQTKKKKYGVHEVFKILQHLQYVYILYRFCCLFQEVADNPFKGRLHW